MRNFEVAVTFAGEDRAHVEPVVRRLQELGIGVFYDQDHIAGLWGANLVDFLPEVYGQRVRFVLLFASQYYVRKKWTRVERQAAQERALEHNSEYILPIRIDDTPVPGLPSTVGYLDLRTNSVETIAQAVVTKLRGEPGEPVGSMFDGRAPRTPDAVAVLLAERPEGWKYLLFAGMIRQGCDRLEEKYRDHVVEYSPRNGAYVDGDWFIFFKRNHLALGEIVTSLDRVLGPTAWEAAFGPLGEPGDADQIKHLADRFIRIYDETLEWARQLRGTTFADENVRNLIEIQARHANAPIEAIRKLVDDYVTVADTIVERLARGETVQVGIPLTCEVDPQLSSQMDAALDRITP